VRKREKAEERQKGVCDLAKEVDVAGVGYTVGS